MAVTLAPDELRDAEITDGIGRGDVGCAARLWVRYWPTALGAARRFVDPEEVPGLAAEALIGTITAVAIGRGPREDVAGFVEDAVRELGEDDDEPAPAHGGGYPDLFVSPAMTEAFEALEPETRHALWAFAHDEPAEDGTRALTVLQHYYLAEHADRARTTDCRRVHIALMGVADGSAREGLSGDTWLHLSTCAWCTEAFHETAFSNVALGALIAPEALAAAAPVAAAPVEDLAEDVEGAGTSEETGPVDPLAVAAPFVVDAFDEPDSPFDAPFGARYDMHDDEPGDEPGHEPGEDPRPAPAGELEDEDDDEGAFLLGRETVRRRGRLVAGAILAAAAVAVLAMIVVGFGNDDPAPTASNTRPTETATTPGTGEDAAVDPLTPDLPTTSATVAGPLVTPSTDVPVITPAALDPTSAAAKPTPKPAPKPTPTPKPSAKPTPSTPPSSSPPPSSPTASPTRRCNGLQHLLGIC
ncbi:MAG: hypothetical protein J7518_14535 [Nocardioidaceae bacterium]|nr:hypothetical protein [Nocardioidaceae bacterium]